MSGNASFGCRGVTLPRLAIVLVFTICLVLLRQSWLPHAPTTSSFRRPSFTSTPSILSEIPTSTKAPESSTSIPAKYSDECLEAPGADKVMIVLKTGATEIYEKLPTHLVTLFKCAPHFMIFSDLEQHFAEFPIHDAIAPISKNIREKHEDFELYRKLEQYQREGQDMSQLKGGQGWNLDKWKFMPVLHQAFAKADDNIEWFFLIEADTSVSWTNLLQWTSTLDPREPLYLGSQNVIGDTTFAHGGSGVLISRRAADMLEEKRDQDGRLNYDQAWERLTATSCCGDEVIARAFLEAGVPMSPAWPLIQGETVSSVDWTVHHWCRPPITWHHISPIELDSLWQFQTSWVDAHGWNEPYLYRDVFDYFIDRHITVNRISWNNLSKDKKIVSPDKAGRDDLDYNSLKDYEKRAIDSQDKCAEACEREEDFVCMQWMHSTGRCYLGSDVRFGQSDERKMEHWTSGWMQDRWQQFKKSQEPCKVQWHGA